MLSVVHFVCKILLLHILSSVNKIFARITSNSSMLTTVWLNDCKILLNQKCYKSDIQYKFYMLLMFLFRILAHKTQRNCKYIPFWWEIPFLEISNEIIKKTEHSFCITFFTDSSLCRQFFNYLCILILGFMSSIFYLFLNYLC